ncbi:MAG TPA: glycosyl hydrolase family 18 protein, partial [Actinomycetes bacterium]|nr:glycosyl hydrolase family 18 protein [Actinomycetes bacterium]
VFLERLQAKLHAQDKVLSIALPPRRSARDDDWEVIDYDAIGNVVDRARVMTYDYSTDRPGPISPIGWTRDVIEYAQRQFRGVPLSIGVPAYGSNWYVKTLRGSCPAEVKQIARPTSTQALALINQYDAEVHWSKEAGEYHYDYRRPYDEFGRCVALRRVWFGEARSTEDRARLARRLGVQGITVFSFGSEDPRMWSRVRDVAASINPDPAKVNITAPAAATSGELITVDARVTVKGVVVGSQSVLVQRRVPGRSWKNVADLLTGADGRVSYTTVINRTYDWRVKVPADWDWRATLSTSVRVVVED